MKKIVKISFACAGLLAAIGFVHAFDWPQDKTSSDSFFSYFGQLRGGTLEASVIFRDPSEVRAAEDGHIMAVITEHNNDFGWFESTLGNAVLIAHDDGFSTVYGNLDEETLSDNLLELDSVSVGDVLGESGNSGWQEGQSCLEFQVIDVKKGTVINPRNFMPRMGSELPLEIGNVTLDDESGKTHYLALEKYLKAGRYKIYHPRQEVAVPYRTATLLNGATVESISFDTMHENGGRLCISGNSNYPVDVIYPDEKRQLIGTVQLLKGHNRLTITMTDLLGTSQTANYDLEVN